MLNLKGINKDRKPTVPCYPPRLDENMETGPQSVIASELFGHEKGS
jgi:hypothetical protein